MECNGVRASVDTSVSCLCNKMLRASCCLLKVCMQLLMRLVLQSFSAVSMHVLSVHVHPVMLLLAVVT
jgi:hypothetical protein